VWRIDDDEPRLRADRRLDRIEIEGPFNRTLRGTRSAASNIGS
jgi:hypothetical protein